MNRQEGVQREDHLLTFPALVSPLYFHGVFSRFGGVSPTPWDSHNVSFGLGDDPRNVQANRTRIKKALSSSRLVSARQVHKSQIFVVKEKPEKDLEVEGYDGLVTDIPDLGLMIQQADCQAVMLIDPQKKAVGIAHAGWRGSVADIITRMIATMRDSFATEEADLIAAISPSLGPCCAEFVNYRTELPVSLHGYQVRPNYFDFWAISRDQLCAAGVRPENIHTAAICTCCTQDYFSYRRDRETGRFATVIGVREING